MESLKAVVHWRLPSHQDCRLCQAVAAAQYVTRSKASFTSLVILELAVLVLPCMVLALTLLFDVRQGLTGRFYEGRPIQVEFSPVTDFREATCRQYEENTCTRGGYAVRNPFCACSVSLGAIEANSECGLRSRHAATSSSQAIWPHCQCIIAGSEYRPPS